MLKNFLVVSDFSAYQNDFVFNHNSYKYKIDPQVRDRQQRLIARKPER